MRKMITTYRFRALFASFILLGAASSVLLADDRFALAVGQHGDLMIFGPKGEKVAELPAPSISQSVSVSGTTSFQVSYGRDVNDLLTAILTPNPTQPEPLHFNVLNKAVDTDKQAVVTVTFSRNLSRVTIDPGYIGLVQVNSENIRHHDLVDEAPSTPSYRSYPSTSQPAPQSMPRMDTAVSPRELPEASASSESVANPMGYQPGAVDSSSSDVTSVSTASPAGAPLFWSEPVTSPDGTSPQVSPDEMKLVEVHGSVSVQTADGDFRDGSEGMVIPSGSMVSTADGSSAAVFIGGVDSARLLPDSGVKVSERMNGTVRHTSLNIEKGTVFSRVGRRPGETQNYEVQTPQGVAAARGTEFADHLGNGHHYVFVEKGTVDLFMKHVFFEALTGQGGSGIGMGAMPPADDSNEVLHQILLELQPFNTKTNEVLLHVNNGNATPAELAYYHAALGGALDLAGDLDTFIGSQIGSAPTTSIHDLLPFQFGRASPF